MLRSLYVRDYALIEELEVAFGSGLNIITGETGAGKSILIGALNMIIGERASTNVVRSLRAFLSQVSERLLSGDWKILLRIAFLPEDVEKLRKSGWSDEEILFHAFSLDELYDMEDIEEEEVLSGIRRFRYPDILEDPFLSRDERGTYSRLTYRLVDANGVFLVAEIPLYMLKNPFGKRQFFLTLPQEINEK
jgi:hypothetical protein